MASPSPVVLVLRDFVESELLGLRDDPKKAVPPLQRAIQRAPKHPALDEVILNIASVGYRMAVKVLRHGR